VSSRASREIGRNLRIDIRWTAGDSASIRKYAAELAALAPDVILAWGGPVVGPLLQATRTIPIVFTQTPDPVAAGFVTNLARPGGNATEAVSPRSVELPRSRRMWPVQRKSQQKNRPRAIEPVQDTGTKERTTPTVP
jgi:ABC transporter substrate binding protein